MTVAATSKHRAGLARPGTPQSALRSLKPRPLPRQIQPMLCTLISDAFDDPNWTFEPKFDGQRVLGRFDGKQVKLLSRYGHDDSLWFPEIPGALKESLAKPALVDGEIVCLDERGHSSFRMLQQRFHLTDPQEIARRAEQFPAYFYVFDLLYTDRYDITSLPLYQRKKLLRDAVQWSDRIRWTESTPREGLRLFREACRRGEEGIIGKRLDSPYVPRRSRDWVKIKCISGQEFVIGGFTDPQGSRVGLGALLVGYYEPDGKTLVYAGKVGSGFSHETLLDLRRRLDALEQPHSPFNKGDPPRSPGIHWVKPELVAEIGFSEWTQNNMLRQPRFEGLRMDKKARDVRRETPQDARNQVPADPPPNTDHTASRHAQRLRHKVRFSLDHGRNGPSRLPRSTLPRARIDPVQPPGVFPNLPFSLTNLDKVMFPEKGYTKSDVLRYYAAVAPLLLPHLRNRPITLERLPDGVRPGAPHFWQKRTPSYYPDWIPRVDLTSKDGTRVNYALVNDEQTLLYMVNQGTLTFHPWLSRIEDLDHPDFVLFDLDPGRSSFTGLIKIAKELHQELNAERVDNFVKTSGKAGLHVLVPWTKPGGYDDARSWAFSIARRVSEKLPDIATTERRKSARHGRAYVDVMQNAKGHHVVPPYVLRALPETTVSTPLKWDELTNRLTPARFDLKTGLKRFQRWKRDPMEALISPRASRR